MVYMNTYFPFESFIELKGVIDLKHLLHVCYSPGVTLVSSLDKVLVQIMFNGHILIIKLKKLKSCELF